MFVSARDAEPGCAGLTRSENFSATTKFQIFFRDQKAIIGFAHYVEPCAGGLAQRSLVEQDTGTMACRRARRGPRSWCSCASPNRSACSITMMVASGTSTPTSITVVATRTFVSPFLKAGHRGVLFVCAHTPVNQRDRLAQSVLKNTVPVFDGSEVRSFPIPRPAGTPNRPSALRQWQRQLCR